MKNQVFRVAWVLTFVLSSSASADLVEVNWQLSPYQHPDGLHITFQIYASFNNAGDRFSAVNGLVGDGLNTLHFYTIGSSGKPGSGGNLYNQMDFDGISVNDFPSVGFMPGFGELYDSYVTIGQTEFPSNTQFSPDFLGPWGGAPPPVQVIQGSEFHEDAGAWVFFGAPPVVGDLPDAVEGNETSDIVIAQFTLDAGMNFNLVGNIAWLDPLSGSNNTPFSVLTPSPGVLVFFGIAGLAGIRRRRG